MTLATDIAADFAFFDGVETVSFAPRNPTAATVTNVKALRRVLRRNEIAMFVSLGLSPDDLVWHVFSATLGAAVPKADDILTDGDNIVWTVLRADKETLGTRWRLLCRRQV